MSRLEVTPVLRGSLGGIITEKHMLADWANFVDDETQRMLGIAGLVVPYRPQTAPANATGGGHFFEPLPVFSPEVAVS